MIDFTIFLLGVSGVIAIALDFALEATNRLPKDHHMFAWINLYGSTALMVYSLYNGVWLFVVLNSFLMFVGVYGLLKVYKIIKV